jgi:uncharacterized OB-fold protein
MAGSPPTVRLRASICPTCRETVFPALEWCPVCSAGMTDAELGPDGILVTQTAVIHQPGFVRTPAPYRLGFARFGPVEILGLITGPELEPGAPVVTVLHIPADGLITFAFCSPDALTT